MTLRTGQAVRVLFATVFISVLVIPLLTVMIWFAVLVAPLLFFFALPAGLALLWLRRTLYNSRLVIKRILVVDDEETSIAPLISMLSHFDTHVVYVKSGPAMINQIRTADWDLIFLDSVMSPQTGEAALIASDQISTRTRKIPVIFFTAHAHLVLPPRLKHFYVLDTWNKLSVTELPGRISRTLAHMEAA